MIDVRKPAKEDDAVRETATRLRIGIGAFRRRTQEAAAEGDLTSPQLTALSRLDRLGPATTAELARREQITPQAMGATIASLEERGLVIRQPDAGDGRRSTLASSVALPGSTCATPPAAKPVSARPCHFCCWFRRLAASRKPRRLRVCPTGTRGAFCAT